MKLQDWLDRERPAYRPKCDQWCKRCGRKHNKRDVCQQFLRTTTAKSGKEVKVWSA